MKSFDDYDAVDLSEAGKNTLEYIGSFTLGGEYVETYTYEPVDGPDEETSQTTRLTETYDAESFASARIETVSDVRVTTDSGVSVSDVASSETRTYFVPGDTGMYGTQYLYELTDDMEEAIKTSEQAFSEIVTLLDDLDFWGIRFEQFTFRDMYTAYLEDMLVGEAVYEYDGDSVEGNVSCAMSGDVTWYSFSVSALYADVISGGISIELVFSIDDSLLTSAELHIMSSCVVPDDSGEIAESVEKRQTYNISYAFDSSLMLSDKEMIEYEDD